MSRLDRIAVKNQRNLVKSPSLTKRRNFPNRKFFLFGHHLSRIEGIPILNIRALLNVIMSWLASKEAAAVYGENSIAFDFSHHGEINKLLERAVKRC